MEAPPSATAYRPLCQAEISGVATRPEEIKRLTRLIMMMTPSRLDHDSL